MNPAELRLQQLSAVLDAARQAPPPQRPVSGWLRAIRQALGMSSGVVAARLGVTASGLRKLEQAEASDAITLATLRRAAVGLNTALAILNTSKRHDRG